MGPHLTRAQLLLEQNRYDLAEEELRKAIAEEPDAAIGHALLSICLGHRERYDEAVEEARAGIHADPDLPFAHYALANIFVQRRRYDEASTAGEEALRLDPENPDFHALMAGIRMQQRRWPDALAAAEAGLAFDAEHVGCNNLRASALVKLGRREEAGATLESALARDPENAWTHANQGWALLHQGEPKKAMLHFREALRLEPNNEWARSGIIESLKAGNPVYGIMLRYFLFMGRLSRRAQWMVLLGGYFGNRFLRSVQNDNPTLAPWISPITTAYVIFALMTWISVPLFNLFLRVHPIGKHALSREQKTASNWVGGCILAGLLCLGAGFAFKSEEARFAALSFGLLLLPICATFNTHEGWPRKVMAGYTGLLFVSALGIFALDLLPYSIPPGLTLVLVNFFIWGSFLSGWVGNALAMTVPRR